MIIDDLRLVPKGSGHLPQLAFEAVDDRLTNSLLDANGKITRDYFFLPVLVRPNEIVQANFVFQARDTGFDFRSELYEFDVETLVSPKNGWEKLRQLRLDFTKASELELFNLNELYSVFPFRDNENT